SDSEESPLPSPMSEDDDGDGEAQGESWKGVTLEEVHRNLPLFELEHLPPVAAGGAHRVLYELPIREKENCPPRPYRAPGKWDSEHVRLPCAPESKYPRTNDDGSSSIESRWEMIQRALLQPITSSEELQAAILSYNATYRGQWEFRALHKLLHDEVDESEARVFFEDLLPRIIRLALSLPELVQAPIPLLKQHHTTSVSLSQQQISCLLANAFLCTFPRRNTLKRKSEYSNFPDINFNRLYQATGPAVFEKLKCIIHYFRRVCPTERDASNVPTGCVTFVRRSGKPENQVDWSQSAAPLGAVPLHVDAAGTIEDEGMGLLQVDFANKYLGGGVLGHGCVQEEIRFVICPELFVGKLFTECLRPFDALLMYGAERYSNYTGYASSFMWSGNHEDATPRDSSRRRQTAIVAIDALHFVQAEQQYRNDLMERELNKAYFGFMNWMVDSPPPGVATGNWGCGAFGGDPYLKAILQLMVCAQVGRSLAYYTFGNCKLRDEFHELFGRLSKAEVTVQQMWGILRRYDANKRKGLFEFIALKLDKQAAKAAVPAKPPTAPKPPSEPKRPRRKSQPSPELFASHSSLDNSNSSQDQVALLLSDDEEANAMMMAASLEASTSEEVAVSTDAKAEASDAPPAMRQLTLLDMLDSHYEQGQATKRPRSSPNCSKGPAKSRKEDAEDAEDGEGSGK
ncbi:hypothetical protein KR018_000850, partial [Drosophila ironensis]